MSFKILLFKITNFLYKDEDLQKKEKTHEIVLLVVVLLFYKYWQIKRLKQSGTNHCLTHTGPAEASTNQEKSFPSSPTLSGERSP